MAQTRWQRVWLWGVVVLGTAVVATVAAMVLSGAGEATLLADSGITVRWGRPIIDVIANLSAAVTIGGATLLVFVFTPGTAAWARVRGVVASTAPLWTVALAAQVVFSYAATAGRELGSNGFGEELVYYVTELGAGKARLVTVIIAAVTAVVAVGVAGWASAMLTWVLSLVVVIPIAVTGHAAGAEDHEIAMNAGYIHIVTAAIWVGALIVLMLVRSHLGEGRQAAALRFSTIALWCFIGVAVSGVANAWLRFGSLGDLWTPYGALIMGKTVAFILLGVAGAWHRRSAISALAARPLAFWRLVGGELVVMAAAMGMAVVLASSAPPIPQDPVDAPSPTQELSQRPAPPTPSAETWLTEFFPDLLFGSLTVIMIVVYLRWVIRLNRRGDSWPVARTIMWIIGALFFGYLNLGGAAVYGHVLFSAHMLGHMSLVMILPIFLVLAAPMTLALRALPSRQDGSRGPREWLLTILHSRWAGFFSNPVVAGANIIISMVIFYFTSVIVYAMTTHIGHVLMVVHFTLIGYMFINILIGVDPGAKRPSYPLRLLLLFATIAFHAFFAIAIMEMTDLIGAAYFGHLGLPWGVDAFADQHAGGEITWGVGEIPSLALAVILAVRWSRDDERLARRTDRAAARDEDAELRAYNAMLAGLAAEDEQLVAAQPGLGAGGSAGDASRGRPASDDHDPGAPLGD